jgi:hypothetical protein
MKEIVEKHLNSGHYGDSDYDFDGWIKNVLPKIKPGLRNVHMFKRYQIWPIVRNWRLDELEDIPLTLHQYLGMSFVEPASNVQRRYNITDVANTLKKVSFGVSSK